MHRQLRKVYLYMGAGLILAGGAILNVAGYAASQQNANSQTTQQQIVKFETQHLFEALEGKLSPEIFWQDAYLNVIKKWNQKWVDYQYGPYLDSININIALVYDANFQQRFFYTHGLKDAPKAGDFGGNSALRAIYDQALNSKSQQPPAMHHGVVMLNGAPYFAVSGQITPEDEKLLPLPREKSNIVIFLIRITPSSYEALAGGFGVNDMKIDAHNRERDGLIGVPFTSADGKVLTNLWWTPQRPGAAVLKLAMPLSVAVFVLLAMLQFMTLRRFNQINQARLSAEAKADAAKEESRAKSAFLGTISHELRTPLNAIIGFADMLGQKIFGPLGSPRYEEYVGHIRTSGHSLLGTINDVIEISRIEAGDTAVDCLPTDICRTLNDALAAVQDKAQAKGVKLHVELEDAAIWCAASPISLRQVIARLLDNAIKFSLTGGSVEIAVSGGSQVILEVRDYGIGISADKLSKLGRPFVQAEGHMARNYAGIGLGLAISRGLMQAMGGMLSISSQEGAGTIVTLSLVTTAAPVLAKAAA